MTIRNNGSKRDIKRILSSLFLLLIAVACTFVTMKKGFPISWDIISAAVYFLAFIMFRSANEI